MAKPKIIGVIAGVCAALILGFGCSTDTQTPTDSTSNQNGKTGVIALAGPYAVTLISEVDNGDGTWTWTWSVVNPNPGNGTGTTVQDLSHWAIDLGVCADIDNVVSADTSKNGTTWGAIPTTWGQDNGMCNGCKPAFNCGVNVLSFPLGTVGSNPSYYRVTVDENYNSAVVAAYYKSGKTTGCGSFTFEGIGCPDEGGPDPQCTPGQCENNTSDYVMSDPTITNNFDGTWTWEWSITNTEPGNGKLGTTQGLSHFDMPFNGCLSSCVEDDFIVSGATKHSDSTNWTSFTPTFDIDPSLGNTGCTTYASGIYVKFNVGTNGSAPTLLRLVVNQDLSPVTQIGVWKSGKNTGCGCLSFKGFGCKVN